MTVTQPRVAIVTGGAQGIGAAIASKLAKAGHTIAIVDLNEEACAEMAEKISNEGGTAAAFPADITDEDSVTNVVQEIVVKLGAPTILINNAGITRDNLIFKMPASDWDSVMNVHLRGAFLMTRAVQSHMVSEGWGRIVNMSSTGALGKRGQTNYSTAKAGIQGFTKALAFELGKFGITANAIAPGFIETAMTAKTADRLGVSFEEHKANAAANIPVGRVGTPEDIAAAAAFFTSEDAGFVSGQVLYVAGGPKG
ncbi:3-oxoacyl-ACP reductase FabG [Corynebacterium sp. S7]